MTQIIYDITLDENNEFITDFKVTTLCAQRPEAGSKPIPAKEALTKAPHIAFVAQYRISNRDEVEKFSIPAAAAKAMR